MSVRPGITDFSSIVFSDEGAILEGRDDPDLSYNQLIGQENLISVCFYVDNRSLLLDVFLIAVTVVAIFSRQAALRLTVSSLRMLGAQEFLLEIAAREHRSRQFLLREWAEIVSTINLGSLWLPQFFDRIFEHHPSSYHWR